MTSTNVTTLVEKLTSNDVTKFNVEMFLYRVIPTILSIVCFVGLLGNFTVVYVMRKVKRFVVIICFKYNFKARKT